MLFLPKTTKGFPSSIYLVFLYSISVMRVMWVALESHVDNRYSSLRIKHTVDLARQRFLCNVFELVFLETYLIILCVKYLMKMSLYLVMINICRNFYIPVLYL